ncbi:hypothetical protein [Halorussus caseinilyticus]|uniref:Uncharacterized protein n=1 Tax=Halorussus caseinilyticus TaxID=3034025 RepID=A0ABD5WRD4_9EURY
MIPGVIHRLTRDYERETTRNQALEALGTIFYPLFESENVFDEEAVKKHLPSTSPNAVLGDLASGDVPWSEVGGLVPAYVGKNAKVIHTISEETEWADSGNIIQRRAVALKGLFTLMGGAVHFYGTVSEYQSGNYELKDFGKNIVTLGKMMVDSVSVAKVVFSVAVNEIADKILGVVGLLADCYDAGMTLYKSVEAYERNDLSVAVGHGIAGLGAIGGIVSGTVLLAGTSNPVGWTIAGITSAIMFISGESVAALTADSALLQWVRRSAFGRNHGDIDSPEPSKFYYGYDSADDDDQTADARMTGTYYGFQSDEKVVSINVLDGEGIASMLKITLDEVVVASATDVFVQPIVDLGNEYEVRPFQHIVHLANTAHVSNTADPPPLSTKLSPGAYATPTKPSKWAIEIFEDPSENPFSIKDLLGIERSLLEKDRKHYLEIGIVPSSLKDTESDSIGPMIRASTADQYSRAYNRLPTMVRERKVIDFP